MRLRLTIKLLAVALAVTVAAVWAYSAVYAAGVRNRELAKARALLEQQGAALAAVSAHGLATGRDPAPSLMAAASALGVEWVLTDSEGEVIAASGPQPPAHRDLAARPEFRAAMTAVDGHGFAVRPHPVHGHPVQHAVTMVRGEGPEPLGMVRVSRAAPELAATALPSGWALLVGVVVAALLAMAALVRLLGPLPRLVQQARDLAAGHTVDSFVVDSGDELGELSQALRQVGIGMGDRLEATDRERSKLSAILEGMVEGVIAFDADERVVHLNARAGDILETDEQQALGRPLIEVTRIPEVCEIVTDTLASGEKSRREASLRRGADARTIQIEAAPLRAGGRHDDREVTGCVLVMHDLTELRRLEGMRRDFVANVSHELKTPLTAIKGLVDTMVDDGSMRSDVRQRFLAKVKHQADRLASLVSDLLVLARIESGRSAEERQQLDLRQVVRDSCAQLATGAQARSLQLSVELGDRPLWCLGEAEALRQMVDNLVSNAIRYTPEHGRVDVRLEPRGPTAVLSVSDTGIGIESEHIDRIFERFYRVDKARSRELGGTGLGLAIVKHVVLSHGGKVSVRSRPGEGSTFVVRLPLSDDQAARKVS